MWGQENSRQPRDVLLQSRDGSSMSLWLQRNLSLDSELAYSDSTVTQKPLDWWLVSLESRTLENGLEHFLKMKVHVSFAIIDEMASWFIHSIPSLCLTLVIRSPFPSL